MSTEFLHVPVLSKELLQALNPHQEAKYLDATLGAGGHTQLILESCATAEVTAIDRDEQAIEAVSDRLSQYIPKRLNICHENFAEHQPQSLYDGIIADLGVSSPQLDNVARGFSFRAAAPLDMRMDVRQVLTAAEIINHWGEKDLAEIFFRYGEERLSRRIARQIVNKRPLQTTTELAEAIASCVPRAYRYGRIHPATRVFQALRIVVNRELDSLEAFLSQAPQWLKPGGIIAIISFHSLEDRLVKHQFRESEFLDILSKKPIMPTEEERYQNARSRSAKLRIAQRKKT